MAKGQSARSQQASAAAAPPRSAATPLPVPAFFAATFSLVTGARVAGGYELQGGEQQQEFFLAEVGDLVEEWMAGLDDPAEGWLTVVGESRYEHQGLPDEVRQGLRELLAEGGFPPPPFRAAGCRLEFFYHSQKTTPFVDFSEGEHTSFAGPVRLGRRAGFSSPEPGLEPAMKEELRELRTLVKNLRGDVQALKQAVERLAAKGEPARGDSRPGLTEKQRQVLDAIELVPGTASKARRKVQGLLGQLEGERMTEALTHALKELLGQRGWRVRCKCGEPATPIWRRSSAYASGGCMQFSHLGETGRTVTHGGRATLPKLVLVEHADRRTRPAPSA